MLSACRQDQDRNHATLNRQANCGAPIPGPLHAPATSRRGLARVLAPHVANLPAPEWPFLACEADVHWPNRMVSEVMQAIVVEKLGGPEELQMQEWPGRPLRPAKSVSMSTGSGSTSWTLGDAGVGGQLANCLSAQAWGGRAGSA